MDYTIRRLKQEEAGILDTFLYEAIFIPEGVEAPPRDIINQPELQVYVATLETEWGIWHLSQRQMIKLLELCGFVLWTTMGMLMTIHRLLQSRCSKNTGITELALS